MEFIGNSELCHSWCRLCLKLDVVNLNLFDQTCREKQVTMKLNTCFPLKISENDDKRTHNICLLCLLTLEATYELRQKAIRSDKMLRAMLHRNQDKLETVVLSSTEMALPEQNKINIRCTSNLSEMDKVPTFNNVIPQVSKHTAGKENMPIQFTAPYSVINVENLKSPDMQKQVKQRFKKMKPIDKFVDSQSHEHLNTIIINNKTFSQTPRSIKQKEPAHFPMLIRSPVPQSTAIQRKRPREHSEGTNADNNRELPSNDKFQSMNLASLPATPRRNMISQKHCIQVPPNMPEKCNDLQRKFKMLPTNGGNTLTTNNTVSSQDVSRYKPRSPLTEKVSSIENYSVINVQTPRKKKTDNNSVKIVATMTPVVKKTNITTAEKIRKSERTQLNLENESTEFKMGNVFELSNVNAGNLKTKNERGTTDKCIDKSRAQIQAQTPAKVFPAEELAKKTKNHQIKMKKVDKDETKSANKANRDIFKFTDSPIMNMSYSYGKQNAKRTTAIESTERYFKTRPVQNDNDRDSQMEKQPQQDKLLSSKDHSTPSPSINECSDSSFGTLLKDIPSSQSEEQAMPVKSLTKLLPEDVRDSWKKASGTWASENISNESEDPFNDGDLGACMATGDIFGASIARKISNRNAKNDKLEESATQKEYDVNKKGTKRGITTMPSPLSTPSSSGGPPKSSISSLNLSSGDDSPKKYNTRSTLINPSPITIPQATVNPKSFKIVQDSSKSQMTPHNFQKTGGSSERAVASEESSQSDSLDFPLMPEIVRQGKH